MHAEKDSCLAKLGFLVARKKSSSRPEFIPARFFVILPKHACVYEGKHLGILLDVKRCATSQAACVQNIQ